MWRATVHVFSFFYHFEFFCLFKFTSAVLISMYQGKYNGCCCYVIVVAVVLNK